MTTNQSFIKAYRQDGAQNGPSRPAAEPARTEANARPPALETATSVSYVSVSAAAFTTSFDTRSVTTLRDDAPPRAPLGQIPQYAPPRPRTDTGRSAKRPLSAFAAQRRGGAIATPAGTDQQGFRPSTTIASFRWPAVCRTLCRDAGPELDRLSDRMLNPTGTAHSVVGVMGLFAGGGCTTTFLSLAMRLATRDRRTLLAEGNFAAPKLANWLDAVPTASWQDVLSRGAPLEDAVVRATDDHLDLLPLDSENDEPLALAASSKIASTTATLRQAYDLVLVDLGPFFDPVSQPILLQVVRSMRIDAVLGVAGPEPADARDLATIAEYLGRSGCQLLGTVVNRITAIVNY